MKLSVIIPVYNERQTLPQILPKVIAALPTVPKELILVDDGSRDGTREWLVEKFGEPKEGYWRGMGSGIGEDPKKSVEVQVIFHQRNQGKGKALRTGFEAATGDVLVIQDGDLEYDPQDWEKMWRLIDEGWADVVYGSRFYGNPHRVLYFHHYLGNKVITSLIDLICNINLSDIEVCYKMFRREVWETLKLSCNDFGFEVEFTMKVTRSPRRWRIYEVGIAYYGRTFEEGKKINWRDGFKALGYIFKFTFSS